MVWLQSGEPMGAFCGVLLRANLLRATPVPPATDAPVETDPARCRSAFGLRFVLPPCRHGAYRLAANLHGRLTVDNLTGALPKCTSAVATSTEARAQLEPAPKIIIFFACGAPHRLLSAKKSGAKLPADFLKAISKAQNLTL